MVHDRLLAGIDWTPTYINSLTASTPAAIRTPIHFPSDRQCLEKISPTVGKLDGEGITYCRVRNTLELIHGFVSENLVPTLYPEAQVISAPFEPAFDANGDLPDWADVLEPAGVKPVGARSH